MAAYELLYHILFHAITSAIEAQSKGNYELSLQILMTAQQNAEEKFIDG